jgi:hypothetical protein
VVCGVVYPCQIWHMPHLTLIGKCDSISIPASSSLDHYTTAEEHGSSSLLQKAGSHLRMSEVMMEIILWSVG